MATHKIGNLKINRSEDGIAFRFGDGKIHRLGLGKTKEPVAPEYNEDLYDEDGYPRDEYTPEGYSGRFHAGSRAYDEDYEQDYAEEAYDDGYGQYDEGEYEDGYSDEYYEEGAYDDRYSDEDAGGYEDGAYDDGYYASASPLLRYVDENDWVTYLLLVVLPPLGIYLLWRRQRFDRPLRLGLSAVSAVWFIVLLVLIFSAIFSGSSEHTTNPPLTITSPQPTVELTPSPTPDPLVSATPNAQGGLNGIGIGSSGQTGIQPAVTTDPLAPNVSPTPISSFNANTGVGTAVTSNTVITTSTGSYYHNNASCVNIEAGASRSNVTKEVAESRGKAPCPLCYPNQKTYYATSGGKYYHLVRDCSNMENASIITKEAAIEQGKDACPACIEGKVQSLASGALRFANASTSDKSGITVYATENGKYFHSNSSCSGMKGAVSGSLLKAMLAGKTACPSCCASAGTKVYCTQGGRYYHNTSDCSGMENAFQITLGEALVLGKQRCSVCLTGSVTIGGVSNEDDDSGVYVYGTQYGKYYHTNASCSGMSGASRYTLKSMIVAGRPACPVCCSGSDTTVYATEKGTYYHSYATCSGMKNATPGTLAEALAYGKQKCPACWSSTGTMKDTEEAKSGTYVYATQSGTYYHTYSKCSGMSGATKLSLESALKYGKKACPDCASAASRTVYSMKYGTYYHNTANCGNERGMSKRTLEEALTKGQKSCPYCIGGKTAAQVEKENMSKLESSGTYRSGTSGIKVYATSTSEHFHNVSDCYGMVNASRITLETALNYGKTPCSKCLSDARDTVYAAKGGKYYHLSKSCAGDGATKGTRAEALAYGFDACPYCVTKTMTNESSDTYKSGTSGINVYASTNGKYYHKDKTCAGGSASRVTLESALNYGKTPCPSCASAAGKTVYSSSGDKYYHSSRTCAGSGATSGDFAKALALGKKECPVCVAGSESYEESDIKYSAPASTSVYVDLDSEMLYYHKDSRCSDAGFRNGTKQTLEFVVDLDFKPCPYCAPPTSVSG